jgi:hypothetical protein
MANASNWQLCRPPQTFSPRKVQIQFLLDDSDDFSETLIKLISSDKIPLLTQMDIVALIAFVNLIVQIITLSIVIFGYAMKRKMKFRQHGTLMIVAVTMQFFSFLLIMGPAFVILIGNGFLQRPILFSTVTLFHAGLGSVSLAAGIWIGGSWRLQTSFVNCIKKRLAMRYVIVTWILALLLGITLYMLNYVF